MLTGTIYLTDNPDIIMNTDFRSVKIINMDEDDILPKYDNFITATCLLPPMECNIAEADGNEALYNKYYTDHLLAPFQKEFISALIAFLYKGGNLLIFLPEVGYTNTKTKFMEFMYTLYGIHIGIAGSNNPNELCFYDNSCIPMWLNLLYESNIISAYELLYKLPLDATIYPNSTIMSKLISEIKPYEKSYADSANYILRFHKLIHKNPNIRPAISIMEDKIYAFMG